MCVIKGMKTAYLKVTNPGFKLSYLTEILPDEMLYVVFTYQSLKKPQASINLTVALHDFPTLNAVFCLFFFYRSRYKSMGVICQ